LRAMRGNSGSLFLGPRGDVNHMCNVDTRGSQIGKCRWR
jgi:hypothetical protein